MNANAWVKVQAVSSLLFVTFLLPHLVNVGIAVLGPESFNAFQQTLRTVYQSPWVEWAILGSLLVHAVAGVVRLKQRGLSRSGHRQRLHVVAGLVLLVFFIGHVVATRGASLMYDVYPQFEGIAFTFRWVPAWFWPYYLVFGLSGALHASLGLRVSLGVLAPTWGRWFTEWKIDLALSVVLCVLTVAGVTALGGLWFDVGQPEHSAYAQLLRRLGMAP